MQLKLARCNMGMEEPGIGRSCDGAHSAGSAQTHQPFTLPILVQPKNSPEMTLLIWGIARSSQVHSCEIFVFTDQLQLQRALLGSELARTSLGQQGRDQHVAMLHQHPISQPPPAAPSAACRKVSARVAGDTQCSLRQGCAGLILPSASQ